MGFLEIGFGLLLGLVLGWVLRWRFGSKPDMRLEQQLREQLEQVTIEVTRLRGECVEKGEQLAATRAELLAGRQLLTEQQQRHEKEWQSAKENQERALSDLQKAFQALSSEALRQTQPEFLRLANETFGKLAESAKGDLAQRQQAIETLLKPLEEQLKHYQHRLAQTETTQTTALGELRKQLEMLGMQSNVLAAETQQFREVLRSSPARGRWGEETLRRVVEAAGMSVHCDFSEQIKAGEMKPDLTVHLPGGRVIIVDAKVPDLECLATLPADEVKRAQAFEMHARKLKDTIRDLAARNYPHQIENALDFVVLFLPAESLFSAALEGDRELIVWAAKQRILLATPASLIALLRSVSLSWQQFAQNENAKKILDEAIVLYDRVTKFIEHFAKIRSGLSSAVDAYDRAVGSYERMVRPSGQRLMELGVGANSRELAEVSDLRIELRLAPGGVDEDARKRGGDGELRKTAVELEDVA